MSNTFKITLIVTGVVVAAVFLLAAGFIIGRIGWWAGSFGPGWMMSSQPNNAPGWDTPWQGPGGMGPGMMGGFHRRGGGPGSGNFGGHMGQGMMGGYWGSNQAQAEPLSLEQAEAALEDFLSDYGDDDLEVEEIMIFDNHAYAEIVEESTGIGAMEVLVDPLSLQVYPEHGPNMMWNLKYGMMSGNAGFGGMGHGMMGGFGWGNRNQVGDVAADMAVSPEEAVEAAQRYLDINMPGAQADEHADRFYGYYTLHILRDGEVTGMLSVNGYNRQIFPHTWHGEFIEMSAEH